MNTFKLIVLAADKPFYEGKCNSLVFSTIDGEHGVQANHCNMIAAIVPGTLRIVTPENGEEIAADGISGYTRVCVEGIPCGFGKASGGRLKNYYPKGLRTL